MKKVKNLKIDDIFYYYSYTTKRSLGFARVHKILDDVITCTHIFLDEKETSGGFILTKDYVVLDIIINRRSDMSIIRELCPEYFL